MIASLAHQIRTPLATALLYLSNSSHPQARNNDRVHYAEKARERLHHLERMVSDMLVFARGEVSDSESFDLAEFINDFRLVLEPQFNDSATILTIDNGVNNASLHGNRDALLSAFQNLVNNAIESGEDELKLDITVSYTKENMIEFCFKDNGCGMSEDIKNRVMEPFFTTRSNGTGLGLAVVNATVSSFNGVFDIHTETGVGSCFVVKLPLQADSVLLSSEMTQSDPRVHGHKQDYTSKVDKSNEYHHRKEVSV